MTEVRVGDVRISFLDDIFVVTGVGLVNISVIFNDKCSCRLPRYIVENYKLIKHYDTVSEAIASKEFNQ